MCKMGNFYRLNIELLFGSLKLTKLSEIVISYCKGIEVKNKPLVSVWGYSFYFLIRETIRNLEKNLKLFYQNIKHRLYNIML